MKTSLPKSLFQALAIIVLALSTLGVIPVRADGLSQISLVSLGTQYTQNFDTLSNTAGSTTNTLTLDGWHMTESGGGARDNELYAVTDGTSSTGDIYSYGTTGSTDRALGGQLSGTLIPTYGASFTNNTGHTIDTLAISYIGEEWRLGLAGRTDRIDFQYSLDATALYTGSWTDVNALDFTTPDTTAPTGEKNGNAAGFRTTISSSISGLNIPNGATFWIRWNDADASSADDGLAVDDFSLTPYNCHEITVTNANDSGAGTLRQAIADSCAGGTITFAGDYAIDLGSELSIDHDLTIDGAGHNVTVNGGNLTRVFYVSNVIAAIKNLTIANGRATGGGSGIYLYYGTLTLTNDMLSGNTANDPTYSGGGIYNYYGTLNIRNSTFSANSATNGGGSGDTGSGGGIYNNSGVVSINNSTFSGNMATDASGGGSGGGIYNHNGTLTINNSTFSGNDASVSSGGNAGGSILNLGSTATATNTIVTNSPSGVNCAGSLTDGGHNLEWGAGSASTSCGFATTSKDPRLSGLSDFGGLTRTFALLPGSMAIDTGDPTTCAGLPGGDMDQRGTNRVGTCDIGSFESRGFTLIKSGGDSQSAQVNTAFANPLAVSVSSAFGEPVDGGAVTFNPPSSGASAVISGSPVTIAGGSASGNATANTTPGSYLVSASASGASDVSFSLTNYNPTNTPGPTLTPTSTPTATPQSAFVSLSIHDSLHNVVTSALTGTTLHARAAVSGFGTTPTGTISFTRYNNVSCSGSGVTAGTLPLTAGAADPSSGAILGNDGLSFKAHYSGDSSFTAADSLCKAISTSPDLTVLSLSSSTVPYDGATLSSSPATLRVQFNKNALHGNAADGHSADNPANYLLVSRGVNAAYDTVSCAGGVVADDSMVTVDSVSYNAATYTATLNINGGTNLPAGYYRLFVCGTTSITDPTGVNFLNAHLDDSRVSFRVTSGSGSSSGSSDPDDAENVKRLPATGFAPGRIYPLSDPPVSYLDQGKLRLEIPRLSVDTSIVGVPVSKDGIAWDVTWLGRNAGWLNGTAFPSFEGNSVITGHVWDADNKPGIFVNLKDMAYGDKVTVHAYGWAYTYEVRETATVAPGAVSGVIRHEDNPRVTLVTCEEFDAGSAEYRSRRVVRAVLVNVVEE